MDERKRLILDIIIQEHIATGQPVASNIVVEKYQIDCSPATVRNEMAELENDGWIIQPYTSAGRIPTEQAYNLYIETMKTHALSKKEEALFESNIKEENDAKQIAKQLAHQSNLAVIWAFHKNHVYYTGVSNLLQQPEFNHSSLVYDISLIIDRVDEIIGDIFESVDFTPQILIGQQSPFGSFSGTIISRFHGKKSVGLIGLIGPMRMDYAQNLSRLNYILKQIDIK